jgi:hypothetical protein
MLACGGNCKLARSVEAHECLRVPFSFNTVKQIPFNYPMPSVATLNELLELYFDVRPSCLSSPSRADLCPFFTELASAMALSPSPNVRCHLCDCVSSSQHERARRSLFRAAGQCQFCANDNGKGPRANNRHPVSGSSYPLAVLRYYIFYHLLIKLLCFI